MGNELPRCASTCPHFETVQGSCDHDLRPTLVDYLRENDGAPCPIYQAHSEETTPGSFGQ
jgi:hypothetical protein